MPVQTKIQLRRSIVTDWAAVNPILSAGEVGYETDTKKFKIGDGTTAWNSLAYAAVLPSELNELVDDRVNDLLVAGSNIGKSYNDSTNALTISVTGVSLPGHTHSSSEITDFNSSVSGLLPVKSIVAGTNIAVTPTGDNSFIISTNGGLDTNAVKDVVGSTITGVSGVAFNYDNTSKTATISLSDPTIQSTDVTDFNSAVSGLLNVKSLVNGSGIGIVNNAGVQTISVTGIPSSLVTDLGSAATTQVIGRTGIALTYDSINDAMFIDTTGVSFVGHTHTWNNITDASTRATLAELTYLSGVVAGTASASRALVLNSTRSIVGINNLATTGNITVGGNLIVQGTTTTVNSTTVEIGDNIIRVNTSGLNTGGMEVYTDTGTKSVVWNTSANRWEFTGGDIYTSGNFIGSLNGNASTVTSGVYTTDSGTVTSTMIADNTIVNADINSAAAIVYSKLNLSNSIVNGDISSSAAIADSKLATISSNGKVSNSATTATDSNTASAIVSRDASGNFSAGTITANLSGNASTVTSGVYTSDTGTVTNAMLAGSIANSKLLNSSVTIGSTPVSLGSTVTTFAGLSTVTATTFVGSLSGTADNVVTNANLTGPVTSIGNVTTISSGVIDNTHISATGAIVYSKLNLSTSIVNADISSSAAIAYSKLNLSSSISDSDISSSAAIAVNKLASSGVTIGSTTINLGSSTSTLAGLTSISGTSAGSPTTLYYCVIDGGTP